MNKKLPTLRGFVRLHNMFLEQRLIEVYCSFCDKFHTHGWSKGLNANHKEHRIAHCNNYPKGYNIAQFQKSKQRGKDNE